MRKYKMAAISLAAITIILTAGTCSVYADDEESMDFAGSSCLPKAKQELILQSFEAADYGAWQKRISRYCEISDIVDKRIFRDFIKARELARNGDYGRSLEISTRIRKYLENSAPGKIKQSKALGYFKALSGRIG